MKYFKYNDYRMCLTLSVRDGIEFLQERDFYAGAFDSDIALVEAGHELAKIGATFPINIGVSYETFSKMLTMLGPKCKYGSNTPSLNIAVHCAYGTINYFAFTGVSPTMLDEAYTAPDKVYMSKEEIEANKELVELHKLLGTEIEVVGGEDHLAQDLIDAMEYAWPNKTAIKKKFNIP